MLKGTCEPESVLDFPLDSLNACLACEDQWAQLSSIPTLQEQGHVNTTLGSGKVGSPIHLLIIWQSKRMISASYIQILLY